MFPTTAADFRIDRRIAAFWRMYATGYDRAWDSPITEATAIAAIDELVEARTVVDLGCGTGLFARHLVKRGITVVGVDRSRSMLSRGKRSGRISRAMQADACVTGLEDSFADGVLCANLIHLHPRPELVVKEAFRVLSPGGRLVLVTPDLGVSLTELVATDRRMGRPIWQSVGAHAIRLNTGLAARLLGVRVRPPEKVIDDLWAIAKQESLVTTNEMSIEATQRIFTFEAAESR